LKQQYAECQQKVPKVDCSAFVRQLTQARVQSSKNTLLAMGFVDSDFTPQEPSDAVSDMGKHYLEF
jgi:hypothetical protein